MTPPVTRPGGGVGPMNGHNIPTETLKCTRCGLFAFEAVSRPCDPGRANGTPAGQSLKEGVGR
jgi:hypothetical protein